MAEKKTLLFAYGSLKRGGRGHKYLMSQRFVGDATTEPKYRIVDLGPYPGLVADDANGLAVRGELYEVDEACLTELDDYEYTPSLYERGAVAIQGHPEKVETFLYTKPIPPKARTGAFWPFPAAGE